MKEKEEKKQNTFLSKASNIGKKVADGVQKGAKGIADQTKKIIHDQKMKIYKPIFKEEFHSDEFCIPNIIEIVDDAVRRGVDVCKGAVGWIDQINGVEILHLYDEYVEESGIQFVPVWKCDNVYCVDAFDRNKFIDSSSIFRKSNEEKLAELENIAYCLGAKSCSVEIVESNSQSDLSSTQKVVARKKVASSIEQTSYSKNENKQSGKVVSYFEGNSTPKLPDLKWFVHDDGIKRLIEMRMSDVNSIKSKVLELSGAGSVTMSRKTACAIDKVMKIKGSVSMEKQSIREFSSVLVYELEF